MKYRRLTKLVSMLLVITVTSMLLPFTDLSSEHLVSAATPSHGAIDPYMLITPSGTKGSTTNPFVILEIVPNESYAEIGYLIAGCEPVDINRLVKSDDIKKIGTFGTATVSTTKVEYDKFELDPTDDISEWTSMGTAEITLPGYYQKVDDGDGKFTLTMNVIDESTGDTEMVFNDDPAGNLVWVSDDTDQSTIDPSEKDEFLPNIGDRVYTTRKDNYYKCEKYTYENKNLFLSEVLGLTGTALTDYNVLVKTITPEELKTGNNIDWIDQSDLIYINSQSHSSDMAQLWKNYKIFSKTASSKTSFGDNDLTWEIVMKILRRVLGLDGINKRSALIMDRRIGNVVSSYDQKNVYPYQITYDGTRSGFQKAYDNVNPETNVGINNNVYKLFLMTQLMDARVFYNLFFSDRDPATAGIQSIIREVDIGGGKKTGSCTIQDDSNWDKADNELYWNPYTFLVCNKDNSRANGTAWSDIQMQTDYRLDYNLSASENLNGYIYACEGTASLADCLNNTDVVTTEPYYTKALESYATTEGAGINRTALAIRYTLSHEGDYKGVDQQLNVLELEPCDDFSLKDFRIRMMVPKFIGTVNITRQTTSEFNGKIEDLNSTYHMIYIGMNFGKFESANVWHDGYNEVLPVYNDNDLNGKIYLHVGDRLNTRRYNEVINTTWEKSHVRLPGNDITKLKKNKLIDYLSGGYPVIVTDKMYQCKTLYIDKTSQIYDFVHSNKGSFANIIDEADPNINAKLYPHVNKYKPKLTLISHPTDYIGDTDAAGNISNTNYINYPNKSFRTLSFKFTIEGENLTDWYKVKLFIDSNADGRYEETATKNEVVKSLRFQSDGNEHVFNRTLGQDFVGVIPWKLEIINETDPFKRSQVTGVCAIQRQADEKINIKILQVINNGNRTLDIAQNVAEHKNFEKYTKNLNDFNITFETKTVQQFEDMYKDEYYPWGGIRKHNQFNNANDTTRENTDKLIKDNHYDMIIFGFADQYENISTANGALDNVLYYIDQGYSVMFTHDTTSYNNDGNGDQFGRNFNLFMRGRLGMDRFGVKDVTGNPLNDYYINPKNNVNYSEIQGHTYSSIWRMMDTPDNGKRIFKTLNYDPDSNKNFTTDKVSRLNEGQLTEYPYHIANGADTFSIATTHAQYYQLNLDDEDLVVWYTLAGSNPLYSSSPHDAGNNYYIYSKGNITYTGVGHSLVNDQENEVKLFVNTMIAAYKHGKQRPTVDITCKDSYYGKDAKFYAYINADLDEAIAGEEASDTSMMEITFKPIEFNFNTGELGVKIYKINPLNPTDESATYDIYQRTESGTIVPITTPYIAPHADYVKVTSEEDYFIKYQKSDFNNKNTEEFAFKVVDVNGDDNLINLKLLRRSLFQLK